MKKSQKTSKEWQSPLQSSTDKYNLEGINYPSKKDDWKKLEKNILAIALNILYAKSKKII